MMTAREEMIGSIRRSLAVSRPYDAVRNEHQSRPDEASLKDPSQGAGPTNGSTVLDQFCSNAETLSIHIEIAGDEVEAVRLIRSFIERIRAKGIAVSNSLLVGQIISNIDNIEFTRDSSREFLFGSDLGITSAQWGIAETGTLVLEAESEDHRLISLVPPVHLCVLEASKIRQTLGEILELTEDRRGHVMTFVTGASRTSDIELTLAIGVHGPRELHIIVLANR